MVSDTNQKQPRAGAPSEADTLLLHRTVDRCITDSQMTKCPSGNAITYLCQPQVREAFTCPTQIGRSLILLAS
jgi:hypothetical protein